MKIPQFQGKLDPEAYLEWERKVEHVFEYHNYSEIKKVQLAAVEFTDYASIWWDQLVKDRKRCDAEPVRTWREMKTIMKKRFVPSYYTRDLHRWLQSMKQGSMSVDEYYKEMEMLMIRADLKEEGETLMSCFLAGLNTEISEIVELQHCLEIDDLVEKAIKVERQLKSRKARGYSSSTNRATWRDSRTFEKKEFRTPQVAK